MTTDVNDLASVIWDSLTGSGISICAETDIIEHIRLCIYDPAKTPPPDPQEEGAVVAKAQAQNYPLAP